MTRIGASQAFFNIVAQFNAEKLIKDTRSLNTVMKAVSLDTFEAILKPVDDMVMQLDNAINAVRGFAVDLGNATVEFEKFYGEAGNMEQVKDDLISVGEAYGIVGTEALAAGSRASQVANLIGRQNVELLVEQAAILAEISDLTHEEAQRGLIQLNQQAGVLYGEMTRQQVMSLSAREQEIVLNENAAKALDVLNTVANRSVALEGDLVKTMTNFASGAKLAGDSFEFMAAASATLLEAGEEQGTAGRALRMMYARLGGDINGARTKVEALGFQFTDMNGQMKSMEGILQDLHDKGWSQLNPAMKQNIAQTIAGNRHYVRFIKLMENFERVTQLAADAELRLDSAAQQAQRALESNVRTLERAETRVVNLQAAIGEGLTPFMIGQAQAQGDFLAATEMLTDGLGDMGKHLGRLMGVFKITQGFLKFGIALQSISVGMEMFASVQRSLQGVEIAVSNLHSKQSAYKGFNIAMTNDEKDIMQGILHIQQTINRFQKEQQLIKAEMVADEQLIANLSKERSVYEERIKARANEILANEQKRAATVQLRAGLEAAEGNMYQSRVARIDYELQTGKELLQTQKDLYGYKAGAEDAYMRQMLADFDVFGNFNESERQALRERNDSLREQHTILQQIKAENEAMRVLRDFDDEGNQISHREGMLNLGAKELTTLESTINAEKAKTAAVLAGMKVDEDGNFLNRERADLFLQQQKNLNALSDGIDFNTGKVNLNKQGFNGLLGTLKQVAGEYFQTERAIRTIDAAEADGYSMRKQLLVLGNQRRALEKAQAGDKRALAELTTMEIDANSRLKPLIEQINQAEANSVQQKKLMAEAIEILVLETNTQTEALKKQAAAQYKTSKSYITDVNRAKAAQKSFNLGLSNTLGLLAGMVGGDDEKNRVLGAAISMGLLSTQIMTAGAAALASGKNLALLQYDIYKVQMAARHGWTQLTMFNKALIVTRTAITMLAPLALVAGGMFLLAKESQKNAKIMENMNEQMTEFESTLGRLNGSTKVFTNDTLADMLGVSNYELKDLKDNAQLTEEVFQKVSNHSLNLSQGLQDSVAESLQLLNVLRSMQQDKNLYDEQAFFSMKAGALDRFGPGQALGAILGIGKSERETMLAFYKDIGIEVNEEFYTNAFAVPDGYLLKTLFLDATAAMESGFQLSAEQMDMLSEVFSEDMFAILQGMNSLVTTLDMNNYHMGQLGESADDTAMGIGNAASEIENLTKEVYNFGNAREELFFGGKYGNVTGSLYKQVVTQGVGTLYHKNEVIMSNNFHGFFNEREAANRIIAVLDEYIATTS